MILKTRFLFWAFLMCGCFTVLSCILPLFFKLWVDDVKNEVSAGVLFGLFLISFTWIWLLLGELRTKAIAVKFEADVLSIKRFMGLVPAGSYYLVEFDGYKTCLLPSKTGYYEYLYLIKDGRKRVKLSQFYHSNYSELKRFVAKELKFLGKENFSYCRELKEVFEF